MPRKIIALSSLLVGLVPAGATAESVWILADTAVNNPEIGQLVSSLALTESSQSSPDGFVTMSGTLLQAGLDGNARQVSVTLPSSFEGLEFGFEGGTLPLEGGMLQLRLQQSIAQPDIPNVTTSIYLAESQSEIPETGIIILHDDPHPLLPIALIGASYMLICGGLDIARNTQECSGSNTTTIGIEFLDFKFGCTYRCEGPN